MSNKDLNPLGSIYVHPKAIATVARQAALSSYGVVGITPSNMIDSVKQVIFKWQKYGVEVSYENGAVMLDIHVILEYGTRITSVTESIIHSVKYNVEKTFGIEVSRVDIHVRSLRISDFD